MEIRRLKSQYLQSNMYMIEEDGHIAIIDPYNDLSEYDELKKYDYIFLTHEHFDHISGVNCWKEATDAKVVCCYECAEAIHDPKKNFSHFFSAFCDLQTWIKCEWVDDVGDYSCEAEITFDKHFHLEWENHSVEFICVPGHSNGSVLIIFDKRIVFSGDSIFRDVPTQCRFPGGSVKRWTQESLPVVKGLREDMMIYPGHFDPFVFSDRGENVGF